MIANAALGQLNWGKLIVPCPRSRLRVWSHDFGPPVPRHPPHSPHLDLIWCSVTGFLSISVAASINCFIPPYAIGSVPNLWGHASAYRWRSLPRVHRHRASSPQGSSSNVTGAGFLQVTLYQLMCAVLFSSTRATESLSRPSPRSR